MIARNKIEGHEIAAHEVTKQANVQCHRQVYSAPPLRRLVAHTATATSANKPTMAIFSAGVVLTTTVLMATAGNSPALATGFRLEYSVTNSAISCLPL